MAFSLSYNPDSYWRDDVNRRGIPVVAKPTREESSVARFIRNTFSMNGSEPVQAAARRPVNVPSTVEAASVTNDCLMAPYGVECAVGRKNRPYIFVPQKIHSQRVSDPDQPRCAINPLRRLPARRITPQDSLSADDNPQVYVMDDASCATITPEVGPNEVTRDTTYSQMFWQNPVYTFPEVQDQNAIATSNIWRSQERASGDFNDVYYYPVYVKNTPMYYRYQNV